MHLEKLKETARKFEQKEEWRRAIDVYLKAIHQIEEGLETSTDLSLYNRVGDLYLKVNDSAAAVHSYERAIDLYADQGFFNNAIALCGKILRVNPGRTQTYLKLAQLHARKNVVIEAKRNLLEFLERMNALGQLDQAFQSVKAFADQFAGSQEIRIMLVELLRAASRNDEARVELHKLVSELEAAGDAAGARRTLERLQPSSPVEAPADEALSPASVPASPADMNPRVGDLVFLDTGFSPPAPVPVPTPPAPGLVPTIEPRIVDEVPEVKVAGLETMGLDFSDADMTTTPSFEPLVLERAESADVDFAGARLEGMEGTPLDLTDDLDSPMLGAEPELDVISAESVVPVIDVPEFDTAESIELDRMELELSAESFEEASDGGLTFIESLPAADVALASLEDRVLDDPENPDLHRELADALFAADQSERAIDELELALAGYEALEAWGGANAIVERLIAAYPDSIRHHQKRVELAFRTGDRTPLIGAYLGLGDALARTGAVEKAIAVFRRVQEHDAGNVRAATALAVLVQDAPAPPPPPVVPPVASTTPISVETPMTAPAVAAPAAPNEPAQVETPAAPSSATPSSDADFVDLGAMVFGEQAPPDTRMRVDRKEPTGEDEQKEFQEILEQFKRGIEQNLEPGDYDAHYDLGVAFKEMGLLDDAIAEFQKAARSPVSASRLRATEALGAVFFEKGHYAVAETVLNRALETLDGGDEAKIGLMYWLGRASEAVGKETAAIAMYERALAVDIRFMDCGERVKRLTSGRAR